jgi:hypothetical protein
MGRLDLLLAISSLHKFDLPELGHFVLEVVRHVVELGVGDAAADSLTSLPILSTPKLRGDDFAFAFDPPSWYVLEAMDIGEHVLVLVELQLLCSP